MGGQAVPLGLGEGRVGAGGGTDDGVPGCSGLFALLLLFAEEALAGAVVDAAVQSGDDGFAVLGDDEGAAFGELGHASAAMTLDVYADLFDSDHGDLADRLDAAVRLREGPATAP